MVSTPDSEARGNLAIRVQISVGPKYLLLLLLAQRLAYNSLIKNRLFEISESKYATL
jgi:hypothetical protein